MRRKPERIGGKDDTTVHVIPTKQQECIEGREREQTTAQSHRIPLLLPTPPTHPPYPFLPNNPSRSVGSTPPTPPPPPPPPAATIRAAPISAALLLLPPPPTPRPPPPPSPITSAKALSLLLLHVSFSFCRNPPTHHTTTFLTSIHPVPTTPINSSLPQSPQERGRRERVEAKEGKRVRERRRRRTVPDHTKKPVVLFKWVGGWVG